MISLFLYTLEKSMMAIPNQLSLRPYQVGNALMSLGENGKGNSI